MMRRLLFAICISAAFGASTMHAQPPVCTAFTFITDAGDTMTVHAGLAPGASPGIDAGIGEMEVPPPPPDGAFDVRFVDPDTLRCALGEGAWLDVRDGDPDVTATSHHLLVCRPGAATRGTLLWSLPARAAALLTVHDIIPPRTIVVAGDGSATVSVISPVVRISIAIHYNMRILSIRAFLEGPFDKHTISMRTSLFDRGVLGAHFASRAIPADAVDSIGVELRDSLVEGAATHRIMLPAWLLADGTVCPFVPPFSSQLLVPDPECRAMYLVLHHRNHLPAVCAEAVPGGVTVAERSLMSGQAMYAGGNAVLLAPGVWGICAGDADGDMRVGNSDHATVRTGIGKARAYVRQDLDLNGGVGATDLALIRRVLGTPVKEP
jgi:hypothetical protein